MVSSSVTNKRRNRLGPTFFVASVKKGFLFNALIKQEKSATFLVGAKTLKFGSTV